MMNKLLIGLLGAGVIATGGYAAASGLDDTAPARTVSLPGATTDSTTGTTTIGNDHDRRHHDRRCDYGRHRRRQRTRNRRHSNDG